MSSTLCRADDAALIAALERQGIIQLGAVNGSFYYNGATFHSMEAGPGWKVRVGVSPPPSSPGQPDTRAAEILNFARAMDEWNQRRVAVGQTPVNYKLMLPDQHDQMMESATRLASQAKAALAQPGLDAPQRDKLLESLNSAREDLDQRGKNITVYLDSKVAADPRGRALIIQGIADAAHVADVAGVRTRGPARVDASKSDIALSKRLPVFASYGMLAGRSDMYSIPQSYVAANQARLKADAARPGSAVRRGDSPGSYVIDDAAYRRHGGNAAPPWVRGEVNSLSAAVERVADAHGLNAPEPVLRRSPGTQLTPEERATIATILARPNAAAEGVRANAGPRSGMDRAIPTTQQRVIYSELPRAPGQSMQDPATRPGEFFPAPSSTIQTTDQVLSEGRRLMEATRSTARTTPGQRLDNTPKDGRFIADPDVISRRNGELDREIRSLDGMLAAARQIQQNDLEIDRSIARSINRINAVEARLAPSVNEFTLGADGRVRQANREVRLAADEYRARARLRATPQGQRTALQKYISKLSARLEQATSERRANDQRPIKVKEVQAAKQVVEPRPPTPRPRGK